MDDIYSRFRDYVLTNNLITPGDKILLSLSAGKDSMFMLHLMKKLQQEIPFTTGIFHLNHLTRGDETDIDEFFVRDIGQKLSVPCYIERFDFKKNKISGISFEEQARNVRYSFLKNILQSENYSKIATAHNMNDNAETVLMRILSGTGITGIKGIHSKIQNIIRPILFAEKDEIYSYLKLNNIQWREDLSNREIIYLRNHLRNIIIPAISERFHQSEENLVNLAGHAIENQSLISELAGKLYPDAVQRNGSEIILNIDSFHENFPLIKFYISQILSDEYGIKVNIHIFNEIYKRYRTNTANMDLYWKENLVIRKGLLNNQKIISIRNEIRINETPEFWEYHVMFEEGNPIRLIEINKEVTARYVDFNFYNLNKDLNDTVFIQPENDFERIVIRNRRPGDRIIIESGTKKIKEIMIEKKLDSRVKNRIPLIAADNQIAAYLPELVNSNNNRVACNFHIRNDTKRILAFFFRDY